MFNIYDAYINALTEATQQNDKYNRGTKLTSDDLTINNIPDLYNCKWDLEFTDLVVCDNCHFVLPVESIKTLTKDVDYNVDAWDSYRQEPYDYTETEEVEFEVCPECDIGYGDDEEFEYYNLTLDQLVADIDILNGLDEVSEKGFVEAFKKYIDEAEGEILDESVKLEEDDEDYAKLKDKTKSEMLKYLKKSGLDVDNLIKTGVPLSNIKDAMDKLLSDYTSPVISDYEQQFNKGLVWDYIVDDNDIIIEISDF